MRKRERVPGVKQKSLNSLQSHFRPIEQLEARRLMAVDIGGVFDPDNVPVNNPTTTDLTDTKDGPLANAGQDLINLYRDYRRFMNNGGKESKFDKSATNPLLVRDGQVLMLVRGRDGAPELASLLEGLGATSITRSDKYSVVEAYVPLSKLRTISSDPSVASLNPSYRGFTNTAGTANNQADETELADRVRSIYGLTGRGLKVGIISDSFDTFGGGLAGSIASGDLPSDGVQILVDGDVTSLGAVPADEGRAMAELIHDIAPNATLAFASSGGTQLRMANSVAALRAAGCDIIVDDVGFPSEPFFQASVLDAAINDAVKDGAIYLTAAGNDGASGFEDLTRWRNLGPKRYNDFDPGAPIDTRMRITMNAGSVFSLQWDNPYNGAVGNATADLDVYFYDTRYPTRLLYSATTNNLKTGLPLEQLSLPAGDYDMEIRLNASTQGQPLPTRYKFVTLGDASLGNLEYSGQYRAAVYGHSGNPNAISVGAVPFFVVPPYDLSSLVSSESFTSNGPVTQVFDVDGDRYSTPLTLQKPDLSGVDGTNTSFFPGGTTPFLPRSGDIFNDPDALPNFFGTSAAAPNVAAIVALMKEAAPAATQEQILSALKGTARPLNGTEKGQWDAQGGYGLVDALSAVRQFVTAPTVRITDLKPSVNYGPINRLKIVFSQQVTGFDVSDLSLTLDGGPNLLTGDNNPTSSDGGRTYYVRNLTDITTDVGTYTLELINSDGSIKNAIGLAVSTGDSSSFEIQPVPSQPADPTNLRAEALSSSSVRLRWEDNSNSESQFIIERAENASFSQNLKLIRVTRDTTTYTDTGLNVQGRTLFYRLRAVSVAGDRSDYSNVVQVPTLSGGEVILDNDSPGVTLSGSWLTRSSGSGYLGDNYLDDGGNGKAKYVRYTPTIQAAGEYYVYTRWTRSGSNATNVAIDISSGGKAKQVTVNERKTGGSGWVLLGKFSFAKGKSSFVQINSAGADGRVVADAVRFLPADGGDIITSAKTR